MLLAVFWLALTSGIAQPARTPAAPQTSARITVSGRLLTEYGRSLVSGTVVISPTGPDAREVPPAEATLLPDGTFIFHDVAPGDYVLRARGRTERGGVSLFATFALAVRGRDVRQVDLVLKPGAVLRGEIAFDSRHGTGPPVLEQLRVRAPLPDGSSFGDARGAAVRRDRTFSLDGVMAGTHVLVVHGLVFPWRISAARIQGQDAAERAFDVEARQRIGGVRIVVSDIGAGVAGRITAVPGTSLADVLVVAFPADPLRRALPLRYVRVARPAADGSYRIVDLAAADYRVVAAAGATEQDAMNQDLLERWMPSGTPVTLTETRISVIPSTPLVAAVSTTIP
jgi:hypothetical protein